MIKFKRTMKLKPEVVWKFVVMNELRGTAHTMGFELRLVILLIPEKNDITNDDVKWWRCNRPNFSSHGLRDLFLPAPSYNQLAATCMLHIIHSL